MSKTSVSGDFIISDSPERRAFIDALVKQEGFAVDQKSTHPYPSAIDRLEPILKEKYGIALDPKDHLNGQMDARCLVAINDYIEKHPGQFSSEVKISFKTLVDAQIFSIEKVIPDNTKTIANAPDTPGLHPITPAPSTQDGGNNDHVQQQIWKDMKDSNHFEKLLRAYGVPGGGTATLASSVNNDSQPDIKTKRADGRADVNVEMIRGKDGHVHVMLKGNEIAAEDALKEIRQHNKENAYHIHDANGKNINYANMEASLQSELGNLSAPSFSTNSQVKSNIRNI